MRAPGMQVLTNQIKVARPGVIIGGIGNLDHAKRTSGHNEDDTPGVKAEDQDADSTPEHRAIDVMPGPSFNSRDGDLLVSDLVGILANRARLIYVNWGYLQWARSNGWVPRDNSDDPHSHVHISGEADADANTALWVLPQFEGEAMAVETEWSEANPLGPDPDGHARSPLQHERDVFAAVVLGKPPVGHDGNPVGAEAWIVTKLKEIEADVSNLVAPVIDYDLLATKIAEKLAPQLPVPATPDQIADAVVEEIAS